MTTPTTDQRPAPSSAPRYSQIGVDIDANDRLTERYRQLAERARRPEQIGAVGAFSGLFDLANLSALHRPALVASTDGVGTKVLIAGLAERYDTVGRDLVNHCVNDILTAGAEPLFFLDYLAGNGLSEQRKTQLVAGVADACRDAGLALLGGETADMPDVYQPGEFDLAGTIVGVVDRDRAVSGATIAAGDRLIALPANGLHTNGYSLARQALGLRPADADLETRRARLAAHLPELGETLADALLRPHPQYLDALRPALAQSVESAQSVERAVKGLAHITGGGIAGNLERILPRGLGAALDRSAWREPPIFDLIQRRGRIDDAEMLRVFNMGVGMIIAATPEHEQSLLAQLDGSTAIGEVRRTPAGAPRVEIGGL